MATVIHIIGMLMLAKAMPVMMFLKEVKMLMRPSLTLYLSAVAEGEGGEGGLEGKYASMARNTWEGRIYGQQGRTEKKTNIAKAKVL